MKRTITSILSTVFILINLPELSAQESAKAISIKNFRTEITGETLDINFDINASGLELSRDGQLKLEFAVESGDQRLVLPTVVYSGTLRYNYERRRELLSGSNHAAPYCIYKGVKRNRTYKLNYRVSVPYYKWMEQASVTSREYLHDCSGDNPSGGVTLIANLNPGPVYVEPEVWKPNPALYPSLVSFLLPEVEEVKARASMIELRIGFPVNVTEIHPGFGSNRRELARADSLVRMLQSNDLIDIHGMHIRGYASPEGKYEVNERLARGRSQAFKRYLANKYSGNPYIRDARSSWVAEDWEGLVQLLEDYNIPGKQKALAIANDPYIAPDRKDMMLQNISGWSDNYKVILEEMYPKLRRIELHVDYVVEKLSDSQARELLYTNPEMLSLEEIYRVANDYEPGSQEYREVYEIAAGQFPHDFIANNNAAAALLQEGKAEEALPYLKKIRGSGSSLINYGTYHYIKGNLETALEYYTKAKAAGSEQANHNLRLINHAR